MDGIREYIVVNKNECRRGKDGNVQFLFLPDDRFSGVII